VTPADGKNGVQWSGSFLPYPMRTTANNITIGFYSNDEWEFNGWTMEYLHYTSNYAYMADTTLRIYVQ
jgi:hypothetical protein